jgi:hypothetical protein
MLENIPYFVLGREGAEDHRSSTEDTELIKIIPRLHMRELERVVGK